MDVKPDFEQRPPLDVTPHALQRRRLAFEQLDNRLHRVRFAPCGERKPAAHEGKCWYDERQYGRFERMIALSNIVDPAGIEAQLENGVLFLTLPKKPEAQPHRIPIKGVEAGSQGRLTEGSDHAST